MWAREKILIMQIIQRIYIYYFEANPIFYMKLRKKLQKNNYFGYKIQNIGIGLKEEKLTYYYDTQSFVEKSAVGNISRVSSKKIAVKPLDQLINSSIKIDFLKTDIEEYDYFALAGAMKLIPGIMFLQFELGIGAKSEKFIVTNQSYIDLLEPYFELYILKDEKNPIWLKNPAEKLLLQLTPDLLHLISYLQVAGYGFNIFCINKKFELGPDISSNIGILK